MKKKGNALLATTSLFLISESVKRDAFENSNGDTPKPFTAAHMSLRS